MLEWTGEADLPLDEEERNSMRMSSLRFSEAAAAAAAAAVAAISEEAKSAAADTMASAAIASLEAGSSAAGSLAGTAEASSQTTGATAPGLSAIPPTIPEDALQPGSGRANGSPVSVPVASPKSGMSAIEIKSPTTELTNVPPSEVSCRNACKNYWIGYLGRLKGGGRIAPARPSIAFMLLASLGSFIFIAVLALMDEHSQITNNLGATDVALLISSAGSQACMVFAAPHAPFAQPYNAILGNVVSAAVGVTASKVLGDTGNGYTGVDIPWLAASVAVSVAVFMMNMLDTIHPPAAATALFAVTGSQVVKSSGYWFVLFPGLFSAVLCVIVALIFNNLSPDPLRIYPEYWVPFAFHRKRVHPFRREPTVKSPGSQRSMVVAVSQSMRNVAAASSRNVNASSRNVNSSYRDVNPPRRL